jgi:uncharacterized protein (TIGR02284 family)
MDASEARQRQILEAVEDLIQDNVDSWRSFDEAANAAEGSPMSALFREIALSRFENAAELRGFVLSVGGAPNGRRIPGNALHQWWHALSVPARRQNARAMLSAAELSERAIETAYERMLERTAGLPLGELLRGQRQHVRRHHDEIRDLRERSAAAMS